MLIFATTVEIPFSSMDVCQCMQLYLLVYYNEDSIFTFTGSFQRK